MQLQNEGGVACALALWVKVSVFQEQITGTANTMDSEPVTIVRVRTPL